MVFGVTVALPLNLLQQLRVVYKVMHMVGSVCERLLVKTLCPMEITPDVRQKARVIAEGLRLRWLDGQGSAVEAFSSVRI